MSFRYILLSILIFFQINLLGQDDLNPCLSNQDFHIVVLGSSTAAGSGPSSSDSTWVNRYRKYLQTINPNNTVTNLAIGGTTTYHIMPDWFIPPANRPSSNPNNNVSQAISLNADAIIVNMPSNDTSNGFDVDEQMNNFLTIASVADSVNIPIWVCTTQPKTPFGANNDAIQIGVRDSILVSFGDNAIDFWTTIALPSNDIDPQYDSGDGTHLNDAAHAILFSRVKEKNILSNVFESSAEVDYSIGELSILNPTTCGDSATIIQGVVTNLGSDGTTEIFIEHYIYDSENNFSETLYDTLQGNLTSCESDTFYFLINSFQKSDFTISSFLGNNFDGNIENDTSGILKLQTIGNPILTSINDTICENETAFLSVNFIDTDTIFWFENINDNIPIASGDFFTTPPLSNSTSYFAEGVRGDLFFKNSLFTTNNSNKNWNGVMINLVGTQDIIIDSIATKIEDIGIQGVKAFYKNGSYEGFENDDSVWSLWGIDTVEVLSSGDFHSLNFGSMTIAQGDTIGVYLHMENSGARLSYIDANDWTSRNTDELKIITGTGISYTFGDTYFPRDWNGEVFYHHGFNPLGDCSTGRKEVKAIISTASVSLGIDTTIFSNEQLILDAASGYFDYLWNGNYGDQYFVVDSTTFGLGTHEIILQVENNYGCFAYDTILVTIEIAPVGLENLNLLENNISIFPNPTQGFLILKNENNLNLEVSLMDVLGKKYFTKKLYSSYNFNLSKFSKGVYFLNIQNQFFQKTEQIIIE